MSKSKSKSDRIIPQNFPEWLIWLCMVSTYIWFFTGLTYVVGSVLGWILTFYLLIKLYLQDDNTPTEERITIPTIIWIWLIGMGVMEIALIIGHLDFDLPTSKIIKSSIGWAKGWALLALYPLVGCLPIRPQIIYRAVCIIGLQTILLLPLFILAPILKLPEVLYVVTPVKVLAPSAIFCDVPLYEVDFSGEVRQRLFTPWGPALGFVANFYFTLALQEKSRKWKTFGIIGALFLAYVCKSRLALLCIIVTPCFIYFISRLTRPLILGLLGIGSMITGILSPMIINFVDSFWKQFKAARADSSRVRQDLKEIAGYRWRTEAPIWGHGIVEDGPHLVEYMPIGSHHTWYGLLFVKGIVGFFALLIPMVCTFFILLIKSQRHEVGKVALSILFILFLYTFGENLEILAYLYWFALIVMGIALKSQKKSDNVDNSLKEYKKRFLLTSE